MVTVHQNFQVNTHLLEELLLFSIQVLFKTLQTELWKSLLLLSLQTKHPTFKYNKVIFSFLLKQYFWLICMMKLEKKTTTC